MREVIIYTDGACAKNPGGRGGWACVILEDGLWREMSGGELSTTNNRMEMLAAIEGLSSLRSPERVTLYSDSQYLVRGASMWVSAWARRGWVTSGKEPVKNRDLWQRIIDLKARHIIEWEWVRGHNGHPQNERCDQLANLHAFAVEV